MELASVATTEELATVALTEAMVATLGATGPTEATMAREMLSPRLLPKLRLTLTTAPTAMVDTDCLTDAPTVDTDFPTADSTAAATTARGKLRLTPPSARGVRTRGGLLTGAATATATATATSPPTPGATPDPTQSPTGPTVPAATALLTTVTTTERRQH